MQRSLRFAAKAVVVLLFVSWCSMAVAAQRSQSQRVRHAGKEPSLVAKVVTWAAKFIPSRDDKVFPPLPEPDPDPTQQTPSTLSPQTPTAHP